MNNFSILDFLKIILVSFLNNQTYTKNSKRKTSIWCKEAVMINKKALKLTLSLLQEEKQFGHIFTTKLDAIDQKISFNKIHFNEEAPNIGAFLHFIGKNYFDLISFS